MDKKTMEYMKERLEQYSKLESKVKRVQFVEKRIATKPDTSFQLGDRSFNMNFTSEEAQHMFLTALKTEIEFLEEEMDKV